MAGHIQSLWRHPVKGFTPERLSEAMLVQGGYFPCDRIYAVEDGPSGFDPAAPAFVPKQKFTVLAKIAAVAKVRTAFDEGAGEISVEAEGFAPIRARLTDPKGREAIARWLTTFLGEEARGPLKVVEAPGHRFTDHPQGYVSIINLASVRDLEGRLGRPVDSRRFRGNLCVEGWPAWAENDWVGRSIQLGGARAEVFKPIVRCVATHVDPETGEKDIELVKALRDLYGHLFCGIYVSVTDGGRVGEGDVAELMV